MSDLRTFTKFLLNTQSSPSSGRCVFGEPASGGDYQMGSPSPVPIASRPAAGSFSDRVMQNDRIHLMTMCINDIYSDIVTCLQDYPAEDFTDEQITELEHAYLLLGQKLVNIIWSRKNERL